MRRAVSADGGQRVPTRMARGRRRPYRRVAGLAAGLLAPLALGCGRPDAVSYGEAVALDSLPFREVEELPLLTAVEAARVDGHVHVLDALGRAIPVPGGGIAVIERRASRIRLFDAQGAPAGTMGGPGAGPGEFRDLVRIGWRADTLWADDFGLRRMTYFSRDGELQRTASYNYTPHPLPRDRATLPPEFRGVLVRAVYEGDVILGVLTGAAVAQAPPGYDPETSPVARVQPDGAIEEVVLRSEPRVSVSGVSRRTDGNLHHWWHAVPFHAQPEFEVAPDGGRLVTVSTAVSGEHAGTYGVLAIDPLGDTVFHRRYPFALERIPARVVDSVLTDVPARRAQMGLGSGAFTAGTRAVVGEMRRRMPPVYAPVSRIVVAADYGIWIVLRAEDEHRWLVRLDGQGNVQGRLAVPRGSVIYAADEAALWAIEHDSLGVPDLVRYDVRDADGRAVQLSTTNRRSP